MKCPNCSKHLVTLELADVEVDHCFNCRGIWLDMYELKQLFQQREADLPALTEAAAAGEKKKKCPVCRKGMEKIPAGKADPVVLDRCMLHGFWFDEGELKKVLSLSGEERSNPLIRLLDDMFAARKGGCS
jgi:Zn-finger nucleic acid-binding protein